MTRPKLTVHRKPYERAPYIRKSGTRVAGSHVEGATYQVEDKGAPGRGKKIFEIKHPGEMTAVARELGHEHVTEVPDRELGLFAELLYNKMVEKKGSRSGERSARGMIQAQILFRKREPGRALNKFLKLKEEFERRYRGRDR